MDQRRSRPATTIASAIRVGRLVEHRGGQAIAAARQTAKAGEGDQRRPALPGSDFLGSNSVGAYV
jgi:hypothetical protein